ncbi:MAG: T9SS type A sorting domain-containing protein [Sphingobacteriales bacterium]|nr:T9SS type A sorting domain-containing protein [Sphingobacteriales bacterium]
MALLLILVFQKSNSQQITFSRYHDLPNSTGETVHSYIELEDGYLIQSIAFPNENNIPQGSCTNITKFSLAGDLLWNKQYLGFTLSELIKLPNGYLAGREIYNQAEQNIDIELTRLNENFDTLWQKQYGCENTENVNGLFLQPNGDFMLIGSTRSCIADAPYFQGLLMRLDSVGNIKWKRVYGVDSQKFELGAFQTDEKGNYLMGGYKYNPWRGLALKTDSLGNEIFRYSDAPNDSMLNYLEMEMYGVAINPTPNPLPDKTYLIGSQQDTSYNFQYINFRLPSVIKLSYEGERIWERTYDYPNPRWTYLGLFRVVDQSYILTSGEEEVNYGYEKRQLFFKTDLELNNIWVRCYDPDFEDNTYVTAVFRPTPDGGYLAITQGFNPETNKSMLWLLKLDENGCLGANDCGEDLTLGTEEASIGSLPPSMFVFPNPAQDRISIEWRGAPLTVAYIYNIKQQLQSRITLQSGSNSLDVSGWQSGLYFVKAEGGTATKFSIVH